jgi:outer membrane murein-binding lipoprotein Lpp
LGLPAGYLSFLFVLTHEIFQFKISKFKRMKKFFAIAVIATSLVACGGGEEKKAEGTDTAAAKVDTTSAKVDTLAAKVDTLAAKVDTAVKAAADTSKK